MLNFWKFTRYCSLKTLMVGHEGSSVGEVHPPSSPTVHQLWRLALLELTCPGETMQNSLAIFLTQSASRTRWVLDCSDVFTLQKMSERKVFLVQLNVVWGTKLTLSSLCIHAHISILNSYSASHDNWCTVSGNGGCRVGEVRAGTTSPMPDHKGFKLQ